MSEPLRLLHVVSLSTVGGIQRDFTNFIAAIPPGRNVEHHLLLTRPGIHPSLDADIRAGVSSIRRLHRVSVLTIPSWLRSIRQWVLDRVLHASKAHAIVLWSNPRGLKDLRVSGRAIIYYEHGAVWFDRKSDAIRAEATRFRGVVCNSRASARMLGLRWGLNDPAKVRVCTNAVTVPAYPERARVRTLDEGRPLILGAAGRLEPIKGLVMAVDVLRQLLDQGVNVRLKVAGTGLEAPAIAARAAALNVADRLDMLGFIDDMDAFYADLDIFLCPSIREPFGLVAAEALRYGVPVLCSAVDGLPEVIEHGVSGLCLPPTLPLSCYEAMGGRLTGVPKHVYDPSNDALVEPKLVDPVALAASIRALVDDKARYIALSRGALLAAALMPDYDAHVGEVLDAIEHFTFGKGHVA